MLSLHHSFSFLTELLGVAYCWLGFPYTSAAPTQGTPPLASSS
jgi:hypothetical protein